MEISQNTLLKLH